MPTLAVHNAEIRTAKVEVKTLTMSGKQVTLAVFRQLREKTLIADDGTLNGVPWGIVNYHLDKCADDDPHLHVVWQQGSDLCRDRVTVAVEFGRWFDTPSATAWMDAKTRDHLARDNNDDRTPPQEFVRDFDGVAVRVVMSDDAKDALTKRDILSRHRQSLAERGPDSTVTLFTFTGGAPRREQVTAEFAVAASERALEESLRSLGCMSLTEAEDRLLSEVRAEASRRQRHRDVRTALADLPQLFIAV